MRSAAIDSPQQRSLEGMPSTIGGRLLCLAALAGAAAGGGDSCSRGTGKCEFQCVSQVDFLSQASTFIHDICCLQQSESCPAAAIFPTTCTSPECARAISKVQGACTPWLEQPAQAFLAEFKSSLDRAAVLCRQPQDERLDHTMEVCATALAQECASAKQHR